MKIALHAFVVFAGIALSMFCSFLAFIAHAWVGDSHGPLVALVFFLMAPFFGWKAWRGSGLAGACLFMSPLVVIWMPPWVIANSGKMVGASVVAFVGMAGISATLHSISKG